MRDVFRNLQARNIVGKVPVELLVFDRNAIVLVKGPDNLFIRLEAQRAQEDGRQELPLPVNADVKNVLCRLVFKLNPRTAVRNDLAKEVALCRRGFEEDA